MYITPLKYRIPYIFLGKCKITVKNNSFTIIHENGLSRIPIEQFVVVFLEPGTTISHSAIALSAKTNTLLMIVSENVTKIYSFGNYRFNPTKIQKQISLSNDKQLNLEVSRKLLSYRFDSVPKKRSISQLRGIEGSLMKKEYEKLSKEYNVVWNGRESHPFEVIDEVNKCITIGNACLYGIVEAAIVTAGYLPSIGFIHTGNERSLVFDVADAFKTKTVLPLAFQIASDDNRTWTDVKNECRTLFKKSKLMVDIFELINNIFK